MKIGTQIHAETTDLRRFYSFTSTNSVQATGSGHRSVHHLFPRHQRPIFRQVLHALSCATGDEKRDADLRSGVLSLSKGNHRLRRFYPCLSVFISGYFQGRPHTITDTDKKWTADAVSQSSIPNPQSLFPHQASISPPELRVPQPKQNSTFNGRICYNVLLDDCPL